MAERKQYPKKTQLPPDEGICSLRKTKTICTHRQTETGLLADDAHTVVSVGCQVSALLAIGGYATDAPP